MTTHQDQEPPPSHCRCPGRCSCPGRGLSLAPNPSPLAPAVPLAGAAHVLMTTDTVGGVWNYALELCRELAQSSITVTLAAMGAPVSSHQRAEAAEIPNLRLHSRPYKLEWMSHPWQDVLAASDWLLGLEQECAPDIVHLNNFAHGTLPWQAPTLMVGHSCVLSWFEAVRGHQAPAPQWDTYREAVRAGLQSADLVTCPTRAMLDALEHHYGPFANKRAIPNGLRNHDFGHGPKQDVILSAGRLWDDAKNVAALAAIAPVVDWPIAVAGPLEHPDGGSFHSDDVQTLGRLSPAELRQWYARAAIYALPARYEPFGLTILEAALSQCALVIGDIPSLREVWQDSAIYVHPDDQQGLASAINALIDDPNLLLYMARRARERATRWTTQRMTDGYVAAYQSLLAS